MHNNKLPAITGIIINKLSDPQRGGFPSKSYFHYHNRKDLDFRWQRQQISAACNTDWGSELKQRGVLLEGDFEFPEEVPETLVEGAKKTVTVNFYERNSVARNACIREYGLSCSVCGFDFESFYGQRGKGFIHVHHVVAISDIGQEYEVDPIKNLRPVCPNCHAMLHRKGNISIEELRSEITFNKALQRTGR